MFPNIHPIFVHFPIALLSVYVIFECIRFRAFVKKPYWFHLKAGFVILGSLSTLAAIFTGSYAEDYWRGSMIVPVHETFADATTVLFGMIALVYAIDLFDREGFFTWFEALLSKKNRKTFANIRAGIVSFARGATSSSLMITLALLGFILLTITGTLGGTIVYGPDFDPVTKFVYSLLFHS